MRRDQHIEKPEQQIQSISPTVIIPVIVRGHEIGIVRASTEEEARRKAFAMALGEVHRVTLGNGRPAFVSW